MTNKEILHADLLDILFENRNKAYGAYALRKNYNRRLQWALGISLSLVFLLSILENHRTVKTISRDATPGVTLISVDLPKAKIPATPHPPMHSQVARVKSTQIKIVPDDRVKKPEVPTIEDLGTALTSTITQQGVIPDGTTGELNATGENLNAHSVKPDKQPEIYPTTSDARFPGGKEAFAKFLTKYLVTPGDLEAGEKKMVLVRFMVDADGTISKTEVLQSDGDDYSREVIRVLTKMPKWIPAMQNGTKVATWFTQPVSFMGVE